jgi:hypothetical protein
MEGAKAYIGWLIALFGLIHYMHIDVKLKGLVSSRTSCYEPHRPALR